jgi:hypothetical protein
MEQDGKPKKEEPAVKSDGRPEPQKKTKKPKKPKEIGGPTGPEPTRYGDWERKGRCFDF